MAPTPIEDEIKKELSQVLSNVVLVGEGHKYLTCLATLKVNVDAETLEPSQTLTDSAKHWAQLAVQDMAAKIDTVEDFMNGEYAEVLHEALEKG